MKNRFLKRLIVLASAGLLLGGCEAATSTSTRGAGTAGDTIKVGGNFELSGSTSAYGQAEAEGVRLAVKQVNDAGGINGKPIDYVEYDNKSSAEESTNVATRLTDQDKVSVILGPAPTGDFMAQIPVGTNAKTPMIGPATTPDNVTVDENGNVQPYVFRACFTDSFQGKALGQFASEQGWGNAAVLKDNSTDYGQKMAENFSNNFTGNVSTEESYNSGDTDFRAVLTKVKESDPDVLFIAGYYQEGGPIVKQAREMGIDCPIFGPDGFGNQELINLAGKENCSNVYYASHYDPTSEKSQEFSEAFKAENDGKEPDMFAALGYDSANLVFDAMKRLNGEFDRESLTKEIEATENFEGITGNFTFDENHNPVKSVYLIKLENGEPTDTVVVDPKS